NERALTRTQPSAIEYVRPHREEGFRNGGSGDEIERRGNRQTLRRGRDAQRRIAAAADERADAIPDLPAPDTWADRRNGSRNLEPGNVAGPRRRRIVPASLEDVGTIHACRFNRNQEL